MYFYVFDEWQDKKYGCHKFVCYATAEMKGFRIELNCRCYMKGGQLQRVMWGNYFIEESLWFATEAVVYDKGLGQWNKTNIV